ncbi:MAG: ASKHA domain-containing protein [Vallitalea sp.]|jgi:uncharacterized 2Fe-2S/4Fe-4S cluster protein (DUF4445 family)|nr:ASKHA domain-containing protein [Vallitalea sp.]
MKIKFGKRSDKKKVLDTLQCYEDSPNYASYCKIYDEVIEECIENITPIGYYTVKDNDNYIDSICEKVIFCIVTLGKYIDNQIKDYFDNNAILKGMILNTIGDLMLFDISSSLYKLIHKDYSSQGINLTQRIDPGCGKFNLTFQKKILQIVNQEETTNIQITSGYMFSPTKTLSYYYGASPNIEASLVNHDCSTCSSINCLYRKVNLIIKQADNYQQIQVNKGTNLLEILQNNRYTVPAYCGGNKTCGKCKVKLIQGSLELSDEEKQFLTKEEINDGIILACFHRITQDITIELIANQTNHNIQTDYIISSPKNPKYNLITINEMNENNNMSITEIINKKLQVDYKYSLHAIRQLSNINYLEEKIYLLSQNNNNILRINSKKIKAYGIGIDIGTTTIVISLIDLINKKEIGIYKNNNPQNIYGADVISRITFAIKDKKQIQTNLLCNELITGIHALLKNHHMDSKDIVDVVISGNTTMQYLLLGINPYKLSVSPFKTIDLSLKELSYSRLFNDNLLDCNVTLLPGISAFIGSDIVSGLYYCDFINQEENVLFIDIGTNGEIALKTTKEIICTSTAAGPAFEGGNIKCGMGCSYGAIYNIRYINNILKYDVINNTTPKGICGSGLVDIVAELLKHNNLDSTGKLIDNIDNKVVLYKDNQSEISLYQEDIRQLQLAKSAISAGISTLLNKANITYNNITKVYLAGGFGSNLNISNAITIGLINKELEGKVEILDNSSLGGCIKYLLNDNNSNNFDQIKTMCNYIELSTDDTFNKEFINNMYF